MERATATLAPLRCLLPAACGLLLTGCETPAWFRKSDPDPVESVVFRDGRAIPADAAAMRSTPELAAAHELYRQESFAAAESAFHKIAENTKNPPPVAEE